MMIENIFLQSYSIDMKSIHKMNVREILKVIL
jgi:hypothetical protein